MSCWRCRLALLVKGELRIICSSYAIALKIASTAKKPLFLTAIDYRKAFDSVNRAEMIEALKTAQDRHQDH